MTAERRARVEEKLRAKGIESLLDLNPAHLRPLVEAPVEEPAQNDLSTVSIDEIPRSWTQEQKDERNGALPLAPTPQQYDEGLVRSFELRLLAEDYEIDDQLKDIPQYGHKTDILMHLAQNLQQTAQYQVDSYRNCSVTGRFWAKHHGLAQFLHVSATVIWGNTVFRVVLALLALSFTSAIVGNLA